MRILTTVVLAALLAGLFVAPVRGAGLLAVPHDHELLPRFNRVVDFGDIQAHFQAGPQADSQTGAAT